MSEMPEPECLEAVPSSDDVGFLSSDQRRSQAAEGDPILVGLCMQRLRIHGTVSNRTSRFDTSQDSGLKRARREPHTIRFHYNRYIRSPGPPWLPGTW